MCCMGSGVTSGYSSSGSTPRESTNALLKSLSSHFHPIIFTSVSSSVNSGSPERMVISVFNGLWSDGVAVLSVTSVEARSIQQTGTRTWSICLGSCFKS